MELRDRLIRDAFVAYLRSREFDACFRKLYRPPRWRYVLAVPFIVSLAGAGIGLGLILSGWLTNRKRRRIRQAMIAAAERSVPVMAYPLMVNRALLHRKGAVAPALVIATFDPFVTHQEMAGIAVKMLKMSLVDDENAGPEARAAVAKMFEDDQYVHGRRRAVPGELSGGRRVFALDLMMFGDFLPSDTLELPMVPCLAEPGEAGAIQMVPSGIVSRALELCDEGVTDKA